MLRSILLFFAFPLVAALVACDCGGDPPSSEDDKCAAGQVECTIDGETQCVPYDANSLCEAWQSCGDDPVCDPAGNVSCTCENNPPLRPGTQVAYASSAQLENGALVIAGWNPGLRPDSYKDLNVGWWNPSGTHPICEQGEVVWETVKGVPTGETPLADPDGPRGGISATGEEVGRYTGIVALGPEGNDVLVTYENASEGSLEAAYGTFTGTGPEDVSFEWSFHTIDPEGGSMVLWTDVTLDNEGHPVVAYAVAAPPNAAEDEVQPRFSHRVATATVTEPAALEDWSIEVLADGDARCSPQLPCSEGHTCARIGFHGVCVETAPEGSCNSQSSGTSTCAGSDLISAGEVCVVADGVPSGYCDDDDHEGYCCVEPQNAFDFPPVDGLYNDIERTTVGLALIYYARVSGELRLRVKPDGGEWSGDFCLAGCSAGQDSGPGASLFVDEANTLHISFVDGLAGEIRYMTATIAGVGAPSVLVDEGTISSYPDRDGVGFVGDDSDIVIVDGEIRIVYSDTANHETLLARRGVTDVLDAFAIEAVSSNRADGNFPTIVIDALAETDDVTLITSTYRATGSSPVESDTCAYAVGPYVEPEPGDGG